MFLVAKAETENAGKRRRTQVERSAETTAKLLDAAIEVLLEKGYSGFRIGDAADRAGISRGGQLHHFATKNELIEAAISHLFLSEVVQSQTDASHAPDGSVIPAAARHARQFLTSDLFRLSFNLLVSLPANTEIATRVRQISRGSRAPIEDAWIARLVELGLDAEEAKAIVGVLWSVQRGIIVNERIGFPENEGPVGEPNFAEHLLQDHTQHLLEQARKAPGRVRNAQGTTTTIA